MKNFTKLFSLILVTILLFSNLPAAAQFTIPSQSGNSSAPGALGQSIFPNLGSMGAQFIRPALGTFTFINQSSASATDNTIPGPLTLKPAARTVATNIISLAVAQPTPPYTIIALLQRLGPIQAAVVSGIMLTDGTKYILFGVANVGTAGTQSLVVGRYTTAVLSTTAALIWGFQSAPLVWLRLVNDGTNITYSISYDRIDWLPILTEAKGAFLGTITQIGWSIDTNDNSSSGQLSWLQLWYWVVS